MSTAISSHSGAGPLSLMSCVRESSPPQDGIAEYEIEKNVSSKKKFWNPRKWFKRKSNKVSEEVISTSTDALEPKETLRSRSTSELSVAEEQTRRRMQDSEIEYLPSFDDNNLAYDLRSGTPMHPGLSVSHDSVFHSPHSGSELELDAAQSSSSLSISHQPTQQDIRLQTELSERLRLRRVRGDTSEDDEGLPRSPCNSPTTTEGLLEKSNIKDHPTKSHSTCSDGSLLSMGSSEMDEDSFGQQSRHSSKLSLHEKRSSEITEVDAEWGPTNSSTPLNHSAAHHKVSIRPRRTHGAPRRKRGPSTVSALPTTPEVNEDTSVRSTTPESTTRETITELYTSMSHHRSYTTTDPKIKCSSLPPGLAGPGADGNKLSRSRSNAGSKSQDPLEEEDVTEGKKSSSSFFGRILPRRSGKKKKIKEEKKEEKTVVNITSNSSSTYTSKMESSYSSVNINYEPFDRSMITVDSNLAIRPNALRTGPAARQRMQPIDIPASPDFPRHEEMLIQQSSPLQLELENHFKNRITMISGTSPPKIIQSSPQDSSSSLMFSMSPPKSPWSEKRQYSKYSSMKFTESNREESKSKVRIAGLSSLQQRVLSLNDDTDNSFKSLTNLPTDYEKPARPVTKSHSFKSTKTNYEKKDNRYTYNGLNDFKTNVFKPSETIEKKDINIFKSISLDSVKNIEEKIVESVNEAKVLINEPVTAFDEMHLNSSLDNNYMEDNGITISGPSHKAIVNIGSSDSQMISTKRSDSEVTVKEHQVSVTKIQVKRENIQINVNKSTPEFFNIQLNKVDTAPSNVILTSQRRSEETHRSLSFEEKESVAVEKQRKFSNDNIELVKKDEIEVPPKPNTLVTVTPMNASNNRFYKKHSDSPKRPSVAVSEKPTLKIKSNSFEATEPKKSGEISPNSNRSSQNSLEKMETKSQENLSENVILRRKSLVKQKQEDEPELMKVFARRSLKLKDTDSETLSQQVLMMTEENNGNNKSRDSDKENLSDSSPTEERKKPIVKDIQKPKEVKVIKEPLIETKFLETTEVTLRKPVVNNKFGLYQRTVSLNNAPKAETKILKQISVVDRPKTETWYINKSQEDDKDMVESDEIINVSEKNEIIHDFSVKPKNFNQRKAEWEKRAQEALRKTVP